MRMEEETVLEVANDRGDFDMLRNNPSRYEKHMVMIGSFHAVCAFMQMLGKEMNLWSRRHSG